MNTAKAAPVVASGAEKTHLAQLKEWADNEKSKGLIDIKFYPADLSDSTVESFARDVYLMLQGQRSPILDIA